MPVGCGFQLIFEKRGLFYLSGFEKLGPTPILFFL